MADNLKPVVVNGVTITDYRIMNAAYAGVCDLTRQRFDAGTKILYKAARSVTEAESAVHPKATTYGIKVIWAALESGEGLVAAPVKKSKKDFVPSEYQEKIGQSLLSSGTNILISALAGCGKTSTLVWLIWSLVRKGILRGRDVYFLAFNANIRDEVEPDLRGSNVPALTTHQFCLRNILRYKIDKKEKVKGDRNRRVFLRVVMDEANAQSEMDAKRTGFWQYRKPVLNLVSLVKNWAILPEYNGKGWVFNAEQRRQVMNLIDLYKLDPKGEFDVELLMNLACSVISYSLPAPGIEPSEFDFDDMLYHVLVYNLPIPKVDLVFVDEIQDWNASQIRILSKMERAGTRVVAVGDVNQAIYMFRGADSRAWERLQVMLNQSRRGLVVHELPVNYRSEPEVLDYALELVPGLIPSKPRTGKGSVRKDTTFMDMMQQFKEGSTSTTAVLCRNRAPLIQAGYAAIAEGHTVCFLGKGDLTYPLHEMIDKVAGNSFNSGRCTCIHDRRNGTDGSVVEEGFLTRLGAYVRTEKARYEGQEDKSDYLEDLSDTAECLRVIASAIEDNDVDSIRRDIDARFVSKPVPGSITFTTGHGAKGLQWGSVFIIRKDLMPSPRVQQYDAEGKITDEYQQELNLDYIARTRAETETHVVCDWPFGKGMGEILEHVSNVDNQASEDFWAMGGRETSGYDERIFDVPAINHPVSAPPSGWGVQQVVQQSSRRVFVDDGKPF